MSELTRATFPLAKHCDERIRRKGEAKKAFEFEGEIK